MDEGDDMAAEHRYEAPLEMPVGRLVRAIDQPVRVGSMLWVFTDPHRGHEFAYNRWYERDHYYAGCMIGPWHFAGSRWVAPRRYRDVRFPADSALPFPLDAGTYACLYWYLDGHHDQAIDWATPQALGLYEVDRGFHARTHHNTGTFRLEWRAHRDPDPVPLELALDHRYPGMVALFVEPADGVSSGDVDDWFDDHLPWWLPEGPVATVASWSVIPLLDTKPDFVPVDSRGDRRSLQIHFVETDPLGCWERFRALADDLAASGLGRVEFAAPFVPTVVGTDRYVDELW